MRQTSVWSHLHTREMKVLGYVVEEALGNKKHQQLCQSLTELEMPTETTEALSKTAQHWPKYERIGTGSSPLLTIPEFLALTRIGERHFYRIRAKGRGPRVTRIEGKVMIFKSEAVRWLNSCEEPAPGVLPPLYTRRAIV